MNKTKLTKFAKNIKLPKGWKFLDAWPTHKGNKQVDETDSITFGEPIDEYMSLSYRTKQNKIRTILCQLNENREKSSKKWVEFGGGFGGGKYYEVHVGVKD